MTTQTIIEDKNNPNALALDEGMSLFKYVLIGAVVLVLGVVGYNYYQAQQKSSISDLGNQIYQFEEMVLNPAIEKKQEANYDEVVTAFNKLFSHPAASTGALAVESIRVADLLEDNKREMDAQKILTKSLESAHGDFARYFITTRLAVLEQNSGNNEAAIHLYENLLKQKMIIMIDKVYLDLGILYQKVGNTEKANSSLNYVLENSKDENLLKIARLFLNN